MEGVQRLDEELATTVDGKEGMSQSIGLVATEHDRESKNTMYMLCVQPSTQPDSSKSKSSKNVQHRFTWVPRHFTSGVGQGFCGSYAGCYSVTQHTALTDFSVVGTESGRFLFGLGGIIAPRQHERVEFVFAPMRATKDATFFLGTGFFMDLGALKSQLTPLPVHPMYTKTRLPLAVVRPALCSHPEGVLTTQGLGAHWLLRDQQIKLKMNMFDPATRDWCMVQEEAMFTDVCLLKLSDSVFEHLGQLSFARGQPCKVMVNDKKLNAIVLRKLQSGKYLVKIMADCILHDTSSSAGSLLSQNFHPQSSVQTVSPSAMSPGKTATRASFLLEGPEKFGSALAPFAVHDASGLGRCECVCVRCVRCVCVLCV